MKIALISNQIKSHSILLDILKGINNIEVSPFSLIDKKINLKLMKEKFQSCDIIHILSIVHILHDLGKKIKFLKLLNFLPTRKPILNHWLGTDVLSCITKYRGYLVARFLNRIAYQAAVSPHLVSELKQIGINSFVLPIAPPAETFPAMTTKEPGVLVYLPQNRFSFYEGEKVLSLAVRFPFLKFHIIGHNGKGVYPLSNVKFYGWVEDTTPFWEKTHILLRLVKHDGLPLMVVEALSRGHHVIWNFPMEACHLASNEDEAALFLKNLCFQNELNLDGRNFAMNNWSGERLSKIYLEIYQGILS